MSNIISLTASKREFLGTGASRRLRHEGMIPAVIYARGAENVNFQISLQQVEKIEHHAGLVSIDIEGIGVKNAIVKEVQYKEFTLGGSQRDDVAHVRISGLNWVW